MRLDTKGLILREQNIGERDKLVTVLTGELGVLRAFVRGAKSLKSKKQSAVGLLCYSALSILRGKDSYVIGEAQAIETFFGLRSDIEKLALAQYFAELAAEFAPQGEGANEYLRVALNSLYMLANDRRPPDQLKAITELRFVSMAGYMPGLVACERCGRFETPYMYFDMENGLLYCEDCADESAPFRLEIGLVSALRHIVFSELRRLYDFKMPAQALSELSYITETYLRLKSEREFKTLKFYNSVRAGAGKA